MQVRAVSMPHGLLLGSLPATQFRCVTAPWFLLEAGPSGRSLVVEHGPIDACFGGPGRAVVNETSTVIHVRVYAWAGENGLDMACTERLVVRLPTPINGRRLGGDGMERRKPEPGQPSVSYLTKWVPDPPYPDEGLPLVPRIGQLSRADATNVLTREGFRAVVVGNGREVVWQSPTRGHLAPGTTRKHPYDGKVQLALGQ